MDADKILVELDIQGFTVEITPDTEHADRVCVSFHGRYRAPLKLVRTYASDMSHREIRRACVDELMRWAGVGVVVVEKLGYI